MIDSIDHNGILELRLARAPVNALDHALLARLHDAIVAAPEQGARALIMSGQPGIFTAGLDLPWLMQQGVEAVSATWTAFGQVCRALAASPLLSVAALTGACIAITASWPKVRSPMIPISPSNPTALV